MNPKVASAELLGQAHRNLREEYGAGHSQSQAKNRIFLRIQNLFHVNWMLRQVHTSLIEPGLLLNEKILWASILLGALRIATAKPFQCPTCQE
jgi:hypothetical protein